MTYFPPIGADLPIRHLLILLASLFLLLGGIASADPQDGPHTEVRISITDKDVRFNIAMNLNYVDEIAFTNREFPDIVDPAEEQLIRDRLDAFFLDQNSVSIDGVEVRGIIDSYELIRLDRKNLQLFPKTGLRALTRFAIVVSYPFKSPPEHITMNWSGYPEDAFSTEAVGPDGKLPSLIVQALLSAEGTVERIVFSESAPVVEWHASHKTIDDRLEAVPLPSDFSQPTIPVISVAFIGIWVLSVVYILKKTSKKAAVASGALVIVAALLTKGISRIPVGSPDASHEQLLAVFRPLHTNVYRAFDYSSESDIYDALSRSVSGPMLEELYTQIHRGLVQAEQGGSIGRITRVLLDEVTISEINTQSPVSFDVEAYWLVEGTVYHWGHSHPKETIYNAKYTVADNEGVWRIVASEVFSSRQIDARGKLLPPGSSF